jgi:hypothetical protein
MTGADWASLVGEIKTGRENRALLPARKWQTGNN